MKSSQNLFLVKMTSFDKLCIVPYRILSDASGKMLKLHALKGGACGTHTGQIRVIKAVINKKAISEPAVFPSFATRSEREAINRNCL